MESACADPWISAGCTSRGGCISDDSGSFPAVLADWNVPVHPWISAGCTPFCSCISMSGANNYICIVNIVGGNMNCRRSEDLNTRIRFLGPGCRLRRTRGVFKPWAVGLFFNEALYLFLETTTPFWREP